MAKEITRKDIDEINKRIAALEAWITDDIIQINKGFEQVTKAVNDLGDWTRKEFERTNKAFSELQLSTNASKSLIESAATLPRAVRTG